MKPNNNYVAVKTSENSLQGQKKLGVGSHGGKSNTYPCRKCLLLFEIVTVNSKNHTYMERTLDLVVTANQRVI